MTTGVRGQDLCESVRAVNALRVVGKWKQIEDRRTVAAGWNGGNRPACQRVLKETRRSAAECATLFNCRDHEIRFLPRIDALSLGRKEVEGPFGADRPTQYSSHFAERERIFATALIANGERLSVEQHRLARG